MIELNIRIKSLVSLIVISLLGVVTATASTIYVPDDYESIQGAVDHASKGDTVVVRDGFYWEDVDVGKQLVIKSENGSGDCVVDGGSTGDVFELNADGVTVKGFTITDSGYAGIKVESENNTITENNITGNEYGIYLGFTVGCETVDGFENNTITENTITHNWAAIAYVSDNNRIVGNKISNNGYDRFVITVTPPEMSCGDIHCYTFSQNAGEVSGGGSVNASVSIHSANHQKTTGDDGWANFTDLVAGEYKVVAEYNSSTISENAKVLDDIKTVIEFNFTSLNATEKVVIPSAPRRLSAIARYDQVELRWQPPSGISGSLIDYYKVYRGTNEERKAFVATVADRTYTDTGLTIGENYIYQVSAVISGSESPKSSEVNAIPTSTKPTNDTTAETPHETPKESSPGFESMIAAVGLLAAAYLIRRFS